MNTPLRLGVNIDHVATIRNARGGIHPDPVRAAKMAEKFGADVITAHLREDRRHISDEDIERLIEGINVPLNLEMAATDEMLDIALRYKPHAACIVPEKREEQTTEGGLDIVGGTNHLKRHVDRLSDAGIRVSLFIEPYLDQLDAAAKLGAPVVEFHVGAYCNSRQVTRAHELKKLEKAVQYAHNLGLECHAGHGLTYDTVGPIAEILIIAELNIGHFLIGEAIFVGFENAITRMRAAMDIARIKAPI
jgi:pyridoxine 5-phosphate synthase